MITYKLYTGVKTKEAAELALKYRLYVPGWSLCGEYVHLIQMNPERMHQNHRMVLAFDGDTPVGAMVHTSWCSLMAFVRVKYRRQGIGSQMVKHMKIRPVDCTAGEGLRGTKNFWIIMGLDPLSLTLR